MHVTLATIFIVFALVLASIAAFFMSPVEPYRLRLVAASLAFYFASILVAGVAL
jgi:hypothetical protein